ncbi:MAG: TonB-dependent receptor [Novosphingobium sp.]|nr:TonB-dependent receptor [Novosphingobium sp.]
MTGMREGAYGALNVRSVLLAAVSLAAFAPQTAMAQESASDDQDSQLIVVTAQRREQSIIETPIAVSIASGEQLRNNDVTVASDLTKMTPGLTAQIGASSGVGLSRRTSRFAIRGQGGGTGVVNYFADVPGFGSGLTFYDLENVQVIKGPVGTLFGRVTTGGAVLFAPNKPSDEFEGYVNLKIGQYGRRDVEFAVGGPLIDDVLALRVAGQTLKSNGFARNRYDGGRMDGRDGQSFRAILEFTPTDRITNTTIAALDNIEDPVRSGIATVAREFGATVAFPPPYNVLGTIERGNLQRIAPTLAQLNGISCPGGVCPTWYDLAVDFVADQQGRSVYDVNENNVTFPSINRRDWGVINTTVFEVSDAITLKNIFSYQNGKDKGSHAQNVDGMSLPMLEVIGLANPGARALTEELQVQANLLDNRLEVTGGFFYEKNWTPYYLQGSTILYGGYLGQAQTATACALAGARADAGADGSFYCYQGANTTLSKSRTTDHAVYTQATFHLTDAFSLTAGYRYTWSKRGTIQQRYTSVSPALLNGTIPTRTVTINGMLPFLMPGVIKSLPGETYETLKFKKGTWAFAGQYQFNPNFMVYATTRRGYNPGGFNSANAPAGFRQYGAEIVTDYEIGAKYSWRSGPLSGLVSFDIYRDDFNNAQRNVTQPVNGTPVSYVANVAKIRIQGFDLDGTVRYDWFTLSGFVTLTDAKYREYPNTGQFNAFPIPFDLTTFRPANVSKWLYGIRPQVDFGRMIDGAPNISLSGNIYYRGSFSSSEPNVGPEANRQIPGFTTADVRLDWRNISGSGLSAAFAITNVTDFNGKVGGNELRGTNGINIDVFSPPRQYYFELNYKF